jgi:hypothetical protein
MGCVQEAQLEGNKALLRSLQHQLRDKIIVDVTNIFWVLQEASWGQVSSTLINREALGAPARHVWSDLTLQVYVWLSP